MTMILFLLLSSLLAYPFGFLPLKAGYVERRLGLRNRLASRFLNQVDAKDSCILWIKMKGRQPLDDHWNLSRRVNAVTRASAREQHLLVPVASNVAVFKDMASQT